MNKAKLLRFSMILFFFILAGGVYLASSNNQKDSKSLEGLVIKAENQVTETKIEFDAMIKDDMTRMLVKEEKEEVEQTKMIYVHVCGSVVTPGVYELSGNARVFDAIAKANGFCEGAAQDAINQAQLLKDGQRLYIPSQEEIMAGDVLVDFMEDRGYEEGKEALININLASKQELMTLPGIGESKAKSIISYREEHDGFQSIEDIKKIVGIKEAIFQQLKDYITVGR